MTAQTLVEKIATRHAAPGSLKPGQSAYAGDFINIRPKHIMTHDNTSAVMKKFHSIFEQLGGADDSPVDAGGGGAATAVAPAKATKPAVFNPRQPVFAIDHDIQNTSPENLGKYAKIEQFAGAHGIDFYPAGTGISHQVMVEYGYATPGSMVVGSDSHSNLYGAVSALGTPVVRTDAACIWATGQTWWQAPQVARVKLTGRLQPGVVGKDVIIALCGVFNHDEVLNMAVEFVGDGIDQLTMDQRMTIANMTTEWGALAGVFPFDDVLRDYLYGRADFLSRRSEAGAVDNASGSEPRFTRDDVDQWFAERLEPDADAHYAVDLTLDLSTVIPHVSGPDHVKVMHALPEIEKQKKRINKAYLLSCVNARLEDLREAAGIVKGRKVADGVEFYVAAASSNVQQQAEQDGTWATLTEAGAIPLPSGCGPCIGLGRGTLEPGEVAISATNRNFKGRMGSRDAEAYLASPAVVAASAIAGYICAPTPFDSVEPKHSIDVHGRAKRAKEASDIVDGFPSKITGRALWLPIDNLNTDGIYSGTMTYRDDVTEEEMKAAAMANYDPQFNDIAREGDIIVAGQNFGTGSSREQAATCLKLRGIPCVIAYSFSETYKRNAFNNGFICLESPELVEHFRKTFPSPISGGGRGARGEGSSVAKKTPIDPKLRDFARTLRAEQTDAEQLIWELVRNRRLKNCKFRRQHPVSGYVVDFYCDEAKLAVELDGGQHSEAEAKRADEQRSQQLADAGIQVIRFWDHDVLNDTEAVLESICNALDEATNVSEQLDTPSPPAPLPGGEGGSESTVPGPEITVDFAKAIVDCDGRTFDISPLSAVAQELVVAGGAEALVAQRLAG